MSVCTILIALRSRHTGEAHASAAHLATNRTPAEAIRALRALHEEQVARWLKIPRLPTTPSRDAALNAALAAPADVKGDALRGERKWIPVVVALEDNFLARDERLACARALGDLVKKGCFYEIDMAVERSGPTTGMIRKVKAKLREPDDDSDSEEVCTSYADCVADGRVGKEVPLPSGNQSIFGYEQTIASSPLDPRMKDAAFVRSVLDELVTSDHAQEGFTQSTVRDEIAVMVNRQEIGYLQKYLEELEASPR